VRALPSVHIACTQFPFLAWLAEKARGLGWPVYEIATGHDAMLTEPARLVEILQEVVEVSPA
jgi:hypothetical protein